MTLMSRDEVLERLETNDPRSAPFRGKEIMGSDFFRHVFRRAVNFSGAIFKDVADFTEAAFLEKADFKGAVFQQGVSFFGGTFHGDADFSWCRFVDKAYFWRTHFSGKTTFLQATVQPSDQSQTSGFLYPGEANFSWAFFSDQTDFYRTHFHGPTYFWRTVFGAGVTFTEAKFESSVVFEGTEDEVCIARRDFTSRSLFDLLLSRGIIWLDRETEGYHDYAHFNSIGTREALRHRLEREGFQADQAAEIEAVWQRYAKKMFTSSDDVSFENVVFQKPDHARFMRVNLDKCLFSGSNIDQVDFTDVRWDERSTFLWLSKRRAVRDEHYAETRHNHALVARLYHDLRKNYEASDHYQEAGEFYYGEMEMKRLVQPAILRNISLTAIYKYLSGYGEQHGLALLWLISAVFIFFPALYLASGVADEAVRAIVHSLEVSTFLEGNPGMTEALLGRFIEGCQRILVSLLAGLFVLAIKRKFERK